MNKVAVFFLTIIMLSSCGNEKTNESTLTDVIIYGGTSAGISAAIQAARLGNSVTLIEPSNRLGGLTTGGLGQTDIGNKQVIGGIAREFYQNIKKYYSASHIAFGSIRMEPVFMVLGQSSAIIAHLAIAEEKAVQELEYDKIRSMLIEKKQILE